MAILRNKDPITVTVTKDPTYVAKVAGYVGCYVGYDCYAGLVSVWD